MNCIILNSNIGLTVGSITNFKCVLSLGIKPGPPPSLSFSSMATFSSVSITLLVFFAQTGTSLEIFKYKVELDVNTNLVLRWGIDYNMARIYFELSATVLPGQGLMFGFSDYGDVTGADLAVLGTHFGKVNLKDCWTDKNGILRMDFRQNYALTSGEWRNNKLLARFHRRFDTCDPMDYAIDTGTTHVIFAVTQGPLQPGQQLPSSVKVGLQRVQLLKPDLPQPDIPPDTWSFDILNPNITIPARDTTYWWYVTQLPQLPTKNHIIQYEGVITKGNEEFVHHIEVFHCQVDPLVKVTSYNGPGMAEGKSPELEACREVIGAWAMGASAIYLPNEAGTAIGGPHLSRYVLLEVHLNNPKLKTGVKDSSGIRFRVTRHLRPYDSGIMELGLEYTNKMAIPPGQNAFTLPGYCIPECTSIALPPSGIRIYASQLHTHLTGKKVFTKHFRAGIELPELNRDNHYSPHFQEIRTLPRHVHVLPGDALLTSCVDSTANRSSITLGGFSIREEMCVNYVHYYPRCQLEVCKSSVADHSLHRFFQLANATQNSDDVAERYQSVDWTPSKVASLQKLYQHAPISMQCNTSSGVRFPGYWSTKSVPRILLPRKSASTGCVKDIPWVIP
ncbi:dopamine beta-hydroxylase-like [Crassostrea angulata]|uniref:dopamine beta-hydroxylase-like n=1 Tax=Magallana angulata TaxID=2784310 RepID=UPI0022B1453C|nr:dopamine beta-hydroxylase-like [Crassostrea angulata]